MNKFGGVFPPPNTTVQEVGATSSDVAELAANSTEIYKTAKETVPVKQGHLIRAVERDQGVIESDNSATKSYSRVILESTHSLLSSCC